MITLRTRLIIVMCVLATFTGFAKRNTILSVKDTIVDKDIVFPASFETDTRELMKNWYLQNYTVLDADVENRDAGEVNDEEYIRRLQAMPTTIEMPYNQVVRSYIDRYIKRNRTLVEEMLGMSLYYMPIFEQALEKEGMPLELKYLPVIESALEPNAVSPAGAAGLWQFMVGTGKGLGLEVNSLVDERRDPYRSSEKAAVLLKNLFNIYNDWSLAIAAYNCGPGNVNKALRRAGGEDKDFWEIYPYLPKETRGYVPAFIAANYVMTYFKRHNISPSLAKKPLITDTIGVNYRIHFNQIAKVLNMPIEELRALNPQFRADIIPGSAERTYQIVLPSVQIASYIMSEDSIRGYNSSLYAQRGVVEPAGGVATVQGKGKGKNQPSEDDMIAQASKTDEELEAEQIAEVQRIAKDAENAPKNRNVAVAEAPKAKANEKEKVADSNQWRGRNAQYANKTKTETREETYSRSRSNKSEEVQAEERARAAKKAEQQAAAAKKAEQQKAAAAKKAEQQAAAKKTAAKNDKKADKKNDKKTAAKKEDKPVKGGEYTIKKGESLSVIAEKSGVSVAELKKANGIKDDKIRAGDALKIPKKSAAKQQTTKQQTSKKKK